MAVKGRVVDQKKHKLKSNRRLLESITTTTKTFSLGDLLVPLFSLTLVGAVIFEIYIPYINKVSEYKSGIESTQDHVEALTKKFNILQEINMTSQNEAYQLLGYKIPSEPEISQIAIRVNALAEENNLEMQKLELTENESFSITAVSEVEELNSNNISFPANLKVAIGPFSYKGQLSDIVKFLNSINKSDRLFSISSVKFSRYTIESEENENSENNQEEWIIQFDLVGYILSDPPKFTTDTPIMDLDLTEVINTLQEP